MKNIFWIFAIILAFVAGYFSHGVSQETLLASKSNTTQLIHNTERPKIISDQLQIQEKRQLEEKEIPSLTHRQNSSASQSLNNTSQKADPDLASVNDESKPKKEYPNEISDEEIDKILPAPFNTSLKNNHGDLREKYKEFSQATTPGDWDINMQHKLTDFILSRTYAKFINLESLICKSNLCEIRLYESKSGTWGFIFSEMMLQDWWDIGNYGSSSLSPEKDDKRGTPYLVLLTRKPIPK